MSVRRVALEVPGTVDVEVDRDAQALGVNQHGELNVREPAPRVGTEVRRYTVTGPGDLWPTGGWCVDSFRRDGVLYEVWETTR